MALVRAGWVVLALAVSAHAASDHRLRGNLVMQERSRVGAEELRECESITSCDDCTRRRACGWCVDDGKCHGGGPSGPVTVASDNSTHKSFESCQVWSYTQCKLLSCQHRTTCQSCLSDVFCGWCPSTGSCMEGNERGPLDAACALGWVRLPLSRDTQHALAMQHSTSASEVHARVHQLCVTNDLLTGRAVEQRVAEQRRLNDTLRRDIEQCAPCGGQWPVCDCGGNEQLAPPRPLGEAYIIRDGDEAVAVQPAHVNATALEELRRKRREAMSPAKRVAAVRDELHRKLTRAEEQLARLPAKDSDDAVLAREEEMRGLLNAEEALDKLSPEKLLSNETAKFIDGVIGGAEDDNARVLDNVLESLQNSARTAAAPAPRRCKRWSNETEPLAGAAELELEALPTAANATANATANANATAPAAANVTQGHHAHRFRRVRHDRREGNHTAAAGAAPVHNSTAHAKAAPANATASATANATALAGANATAAAQEKEPECLEWEELALGVDALEQMRRAPEDENGTTSKLSALLAAQRLAQLEAVRETTAAKVAELRGQAEAAAKAMQELKERLLATQPTPADLEELVRAEREAAQAEAELAAAKTAEQVAEMEVKRNTALVASTQMESAAQQFAEERAAAAEAVRRAAEAAANAAELAKAQKAEQDEIVDHARALNSTSTEELVKEAQEELEEEAEAASRYRPKGCPECDCSDCAGQ